MTRFLWPDRDTIQKCDAFSLARRVTVNKELSPIEILSRRVTRFRWPDRDTIQKCDAFSLPGASLSHGSVDMTDVEQVLVTHYLYIIILCASESLADASTSVSCFSFSTLV